MQTVGVKELKANLSAYLQRARDGENIVVTHRGHEVAMVVPLTSEGRAVLALQREGRAQWGGKKPRGLSGVTVAGERVSETVIKERR